MTLAKTGDIYALKSSNGHTYTLVVLNVNTYRPPDMIYACDMYYDEDPKSSHLSIVGDYYFCGNEQLCKCTKLQNPPAFLSSVNI